MDILGPHERIKLLSFMQTIRHELSQWVIAEIRLIIDDADKGKYSIRDIVYALKSHFGAYEGRILPCNQTEFLMIVRWQETVSVKLADEIKSDLPEGICHVDVFPPNKEGLRRLELNFTTLALKGNKYLLSRQIRETNIVMVADDDILMRKILGGIAENNKFQVIEVAQGKDIVPEYLRHVPDILFLDIHFPDHSGVDILRQIRKEDPDAYVVMLSADSTQENVVATMKMGAQGFMTKPVSRDKVLNYMRKCGTVHMPGESMTSLTGRQKIG